MATGFARPANLVESEGVASGRGILNNLGGEGIASDVQLFLNNLQRTENVSWNLANLQGSKLPVKVPGEVTWDNKDSPIPGYTYGEVFNYQGHSDAAYYATPQLGYVWNFDFPDGDPLNSTQAQRDLIADPIIEDARLEAQQYTYFVIPTNQLEYAPLMNNTILYILDRFNNKHYYKVGDSNLADRFRLYPRLPDQSYSQTPINYDQLKFRSWGIKLDGRRGYDVAFDEFVFPQPVTQENLFNLSRDRIVLDDGTSDFETLNDINLDQPDKQITFLKSVAINQYDSEIDITVSLARTRAAKSLTSYRENYLTSPLEIMGQTLISNDDDISAATNPTTVPGLYIKAPGEEPARAFSKLDNPWIESPAGGFASASNETDNNGVVGYNNLDCLSTTINLGAGQTPQDQPSNWYGGQDAGVYNLIFEGPNPSFVVKSTSVKQKNGGLNVEENWSHKVAVEIDGEFYYLLLTDDATKLPD